MLKSVVATLAAVMVAGSAHAITTVSSTVGPDTGPLPGQSLLYTFESGAPASLSGNYTIASGTVIGKYAAPLGDTSHFLVVPGGLSDGTAKLVLASAVKTLSFYWGSIDSYNTVTFFNSSNVAIGSFTGSDIPGAFADGNTTDPLNNRRVDFNFGGASVKSITFASSDIAFEVDNIAGGNAVPEPAIWAMLISGMGMIGLSLRGRRGGKSLTA